MSTSPPFQREPIFAALLDLLWDGATFKNEKAAARKLKHWNDVSKGQLPAFFLAQGNQVIGQPRANGLPGTWTLSGKVYLYVPTVGAASPGEVLNPIMDRLTAKMAPTDDGRPQTLGGLVQWARINGTVETSEGTLGDLEVAIVPIEILAV